MNSHFSNVPKQRQIIHTYVVTRRHQSIANKAAHMFCLSKRHKSPVVVITSVAVVARGKASKAKLFFLAYFLQCLKVKSASARVEQRNGSEAFCIPNQIIHLKIVVMHLRPICYFLPSSSAQ